jgi:hypothetical protein
MSVNNSLNEDVLLLMPEEDLNQLNQSEQDSSINLNEKSLSDNNNNSNNPEFQMQLSLHVDKVDFDVEEDENHEKCENEPEDSITIVSDEKQTAETGGDAPNLDNSQNECSNKIEPKFKLDENILADLPYLFKNARYFLIKSMNYENVELAKKKVIFDSKNSNN